MRTALYVYRAKDDRRVIYVGITGNPRDRGWSHNNCSPWHPFCLEPELQWHDTRELAAQAERETIQKLRPLFNTNGRSTGAAVKSDQGNWLSSQIRKALRAEYDRGYDEGFDDAINARIPEKVGTS